MRINIYAEEIVDQVEIIEKSSDEGTFTGLRFWLHLPVTLPSGEQAQGPFMHRPGDDDSSAVTFWGKRAMVPLLERALVLLREHYGIAKPSPQADGEEWVSDAARRTFAVAAIASPAARHEYGNTVEHAAWMLGEIEAKRVVGAKAHRWLGYAQGLLVAAKFLTLEEAKLANKEASDAALNPVPSSDEADGDRELANYYATTCPCIAAERWAADCPKHGNPVPSSDESAAIAQTTSGPSQ